MALALTASATILFDTAQLFVHVMTGRVVPAPYFEWLAVTPFSAGSATTVSPLVSLSSECAGDETFS